jgi:hypothetical protein
VVLNAVSCEKTFVVIPTGMRDRLLCPLSRKEHFYIVFSVGMRVSYVVLCLEMSNSLFSPLCGNNDALGCFHILHEQIYYRTPGKIFDPCGSERCRLGLVSLQMKFSQ